MADISAKGRPALGADPFGTRRGAFVRRQLRSWHSRAPAEHPTRRTLSTTPPSGATRRRAHGASRVLGVSEPPAEPVPDSCLMAMIHDRPTRQHFDPRGGELLGSLTGTGAPRSLIEIRRCPFRALQLGRDPGCCRPLRRAQLLRRLRGNLGRGACGPGRATARVPLAGADSPPPRTQPAGGSPRGRGARLLRSGDPSPVGRRARGGRTWPLSGREALYAAFLADAAAARPLRGDRNASDRRRGYPTASHARSVPSGGAPGGPVSAPPVGMLPRGASEAA